MAGLFSTRLGLILCAARGSYALSLRTGEKSAAAAADEIEVLPLLEVYNTQNVKTNVLEFDYRMPLCAQTVTLRNNSDGPVFYKVQTTAADRYSVAHPRGVLTGNGAFDLIVNRRHLQEEKKQAVLQEKALLSNEKEKFKVVGTAAVEVSYTPKAELDFELDELHTKVLSVNPGGKAAKAGVLKGAKLLSVGLGVEDHENTGTSDPAEMKAMLQKQRDLEELRVVFAAGGPTPATIQLKLSAKNVPREGFVPPTPPPKVEKEEQEVSVVEKAESVVEKAEVALADNTKQLALLSRKVQWLSLMSSTVFVAAVATMWYASSRCGGNDVVPQSSGWGFGGPSSEPVQQDNFCRMLGY